MHICTLTDTHTQTHTDDDDSGYGGGNTKTNKKTIFWGGKGGREWEGGRLIVGADDSDSGGGNW